MKENQAWLVRGFALLAMALTSAAQPQQPAELWQAVAAAKYPPFTVAFALGEVRSETLLVAMNADSMMVPASVQKLLTGAAALELLGPSYCFTTTVFHDGVFDPASQTVRGNLYIRGGGDPGILTERLWLLAQHIYHRGIRSIENDLVLDDSFFDTVTVGPGYANDSTGRAYEAPIGPLASTFNCICVHVRPGSAAGEPVRAELFPPLGGVSLSITARTVEHGKRGAIDVRTDATKGGTKVTVAGTMALQEKPRYIYRKTIEPAANFGEGLKAFLRERGVTIRGSIRRGNTPDSILRADTLLIFESQPLSEFIGHMFKYSSNFAAEMLFKTLGAGRGTPGSWENGARTILDWWKNAGLPSSPVVKNGSGMGSVNRISATQIVALLRYVWRRQEYLPEYLSALSIAGIDGTLESRFKNSALKGIVRAKTGTLNDIGVSTLAGYVLTPEKSFAFAILVNNPKAQQFTSWILQEKLLEAAMARTTRK